MRRLTRSSLRRARKARWLIVLAGAAGVMFFFLVRTGNGFSGRALGAYELGVRNH